MANLGVVQKSLVLAFLGLVALTLPPPTTAVEGCMPSAIPPMNNKFSRSEVVVMGVASRYHEDHRVSPKTYYVDFETRCIFKGGPLKQMIRIYDIGPTHSEYCIMTEKSKKETPLLLYLNRKRINGQDQGFVLAYRDDPGDDQYMEETIVMCGATVDYPIGYSVERNKHMCVEPYDYVNEECVDEDKPTTQTPHKGDETTKQKSEQDNNNDNNNNNNNNGNDNGDNGNPGEGDNKSENSNNNETMGEGNSDDGEGGSVPEGDVDRVKTGNGDSGSDGGAAGSSGSELEGDDPDGSLSAFTFNIFLALTLACVALFLV